MSPGRLVGPSSVEFLLQIREGRRGFPFRVRVAGFPRLAIRERSAASQIRFRSVCPFVGLPHGYWSIVPLDVELESRSALIRVTVQVTKSAQVPEPRMKLRESVRFDSWMLTVLVDSLPSAALLDLVRNYRATGCQTWIES